MALILDLKSLHEMKCVTAADSNEEIVNFYFLQKNQAPFISSDIKINLNRKGCLLFYVMTILFLPFHLRKSFDTLLFDLDVHYTVFSYSLSRNIHEI